MMSKEVKKRNYVEVMKKLLQISDDCSYQGLNVNELDALRKN